MLNLALWEKSVREARGLLLAAGLLLFVFHGLFVWLSSLIDLGWLGSFLRFGFAPALQSLLPVPVAEMATPQGMIAMGYVHPVVLFTTAAWAIARGSDAVSGELDRGTLELLLAQPVRRTSVLAVQGVVTSLGSVALAAACWVGTWTGVGLVRLNPPVDAWSFLPSAANVAALTIFLAGVTTLLSAGQRYRWQTIFWAGLFYVVQIIMDVVGRMAPQLSWLRYATCFGAFEPALLALRPETAWSISLRYNGILFGLGLASYLAAGIVLARRDLPAPL